MASIAMKISFACSLVLGVLVQGVHGQTVTASNGTLAIVGSPSDDLVRVQCKNNSVVVTLNGNRSTFPLATLARVNANLGGGNDRFEANGCKVKCILNGGPGNDLLVGGDRSDSLGGGLGEDVLVGGGGPDELNGDAGFDLLIAGEVNQIAVSGVATLWQQDSAATFGGRIQALIASPPIISQDHFEDRLAGGTELDLFLGDFLVSNALDVKVDFNVKQEADQLQVPDSRRIYFIGNSLTADVVPSLLQGRNKWHIDWGKNLFEINRFPDFPSVQTSTPWNQALILPVYDVLVMQPHFRTNANQDFQMMSQWMALQPNAEVIIHTGWSHHATFHETYNSPLVPAVNPEMTHSPAYFELLAANLQEAFPGRSIRTSSAIDVLDSIYLDIENGAAPLGTFSDLFRDQLHMNLQSGRYLMHNLIRAKLGQPFNRDSFVIDAELREYLDSKIQEVMLSELFLQSVSEY